MLGRPTRRLLLIGVIAIAAGIATAAAVIVLRSGEAHNAVLYDAATGDADVIATGIDQPMSRDVRNGHALVWNLDGDAAVVDLSTGSSMPLDRGGDGRDRVSFAWPPASPAEIVIRFRASDPADDPTDDPTGEVVAGLIDPDSSTEIDPGPGVEVAVPTVQATPDGGAVAYYDQRGDQSLIVDLAGGDRVAVPGILLAVGADLVTTRVGEELQFFNLDGELLDAVDPAGAIADVAVGPFGAFADDGTLWFVDAAGDVHSAAPRVPGGGGGVVTHATGIADSPHYLTLLPEAGRVLVASYGETALVSMDGGDVTRLPGAPAVWMPTVAAAPSWTCLALAEEVPATDESDGGVELRVVDAATGDVLNHAAGSFRHPSTLASDDGCTVAVDHDDGTTNRAWVIDPDTAYEVEGVVSDLAADGSAVMVSSQQRGFRVFDLTRPDDIALRLDADVAAFVRD